MIATHQGNAPRRRAGYLLTLTAIGSLASAQALAGAFLFSGSSTPNRVAHPSGYTGSGGPLEVEICISAASESQGDMLVSLLNTIRVWNERQFASPNVFLGGSNDIPSGQIDFESTLVHEVGHCIGLAHPNLATESGLPAADRDYTKAAQGPNGSYDLDPGPDGIKGSADDLRGDDINLHWFNTANGIQNNPFVLQRPVDASNFSRDLDDLPGSDSFPANADRSVGAALGFPNTEAVMQQGAFFDEDQRQLATDDVAMIEMAMSGLDRTAGTSDDYTPVLVYGGVRDDCDITVQVTGTSFAFCSISGANIAPDHVRVNSATVQMGSAAEFNWYFNQTPVLDPDIFADRFEQD